MIPTEDFFPVIPAVHNVVKCSFILDSKLSGHAMREPRFAGVVNTKNRPLFTFPVVADGFEITTGALIHEERFVTATEKMAAEPVPAIEPGCVGGQKPLHSADQVGSGCLDH